MVVFDLDDTLYKEADYVRSGQQAVLDYLRRTNPAATMADVLDAKWTAELLGIYRQHQPHITLSAGAATLLDHLQRRGESLGIITDGRHVSQMLKFQSLGLQKWIDPAHALLISEDLGADKLTGIPQQMLMRRFPRETNWVYVGDNPTKDFYWPNKLGWHTIMLQDLDGVNIHSQETDETNTLMHPQHKAKNYEEIEKIIHNFS